MPTPSDNREERDEERATGALRSLQESTAPEAGRDPSGHHVETLFADQGACKRIVLSERDYARMLALLESPPEPTPALLAAARRYRVRT